MATEYPLPVFYYNVTIDGKDMAFSEVSGLSIEYETITYKDGSGTMHMPGMPTPVNLTLKRGITKSAKHLYDWMKSVQQGQADKRDITVSLMDESHNPVVTWTAIQAFPKKFEAPSFNASSNEVAIESMELMADSLKIDYL